MDPLTHALSGAVLAATFPKILTSRWLPVWGAFVAASPDIDVFFIHTPLEYIEYHRGITHSFFGAIFLALLCAMILLFLRQRESLRVSLPHWSFSKIFALSYLLLLHHIWLDCMNSYGTQVFQPFSTYRVRWNALFIVDPLLLLPLAIGVALLPIWKRRGTTRKVMAGLLLWTILYPLGALGIRIAAEADLQAQIHRIQDTHGSTSSPFFSQDASNPLIQEQKGKASWRDVQRLSLVPDAFSPFYWKLILDRNTVWDVSGYSLFSSLPTHTLAYAKPPAELWKKLGNEDHLFHVYQNFAVFPTWERMVQIPESSFGPAGAGAGAGKEYIFTDLRFGSTLEKVNDIQSFTDSSKDASSLPFRIMARFNLSGQLKSVRFITTSGAGGDSGWIPPKSLSLLQNLPIQPSPLVKHFFVCY